MANFKLIISDPKTGKSQHFDLKDSQAQVFVGAKIGDVINGTVVGISGRVRITGGSDKSGFPMRSDIQGGVKKYVLLTKSVGFRNTLNGEKRRKLVRGNTVTDDIFQINAVMAT